MIEAYLIDPVSLKHLVSRDQWQTPTWSTLALMGKVDWGYKLVRNAKGEQVVAAARVYLPGTVAAITNDDRIIIDSVEHSIITVNKMTDFSMSHWEVWIQ